jgi:hypothetical protein
MAKKRPRKSEPSSGERKRQEDELVKKLPDETEASQEWGERLSTGKAVATGGKQGGKQTKKGQGGGKE